MNISTEVLESVVEIVENISHPDQVGLVFFEWLNDAGYTLCEIDLVGQFISGKADQMKIFSRP